VLTTCAGWGISSAFFVSLVWLVPVQIGMWLEDEHLVADVRKVIESALYGGKLNAGRVVQAEELKYLHVEVD